MIVMLLLQAFPLFLVVLCAVISVNTVQGFQVAPAPFSLRQVTKYIDGLHQHRRRRSAMIQLSSAAEDEDEEEDYFGMELTPNQIKLLRKESSKRMARRTLPQYSLPPAESSGDFTDDTLMDIAKLFETDELLHIRSVSKESRRNVLGVTDQLVFDLSSVIGRDVAVVEIRGFAATLYLANIDEGGIELRTNYQDNKWTYKPKAPRDHRGQIIRD